MIDAPFLVRKFIQDMLEYNDKILEAMEYAAKVYHGSDLTDKERKIVMLSIQGYTRMLEQSTAALHQMMLEYGVEITLPDQYYPKAPFESETENDKSN